MCVCTPSIRTPHCGKLDCNPPSLNQLYQNKININIYTDGSSRPQTTQCAGWGFVAVNPKNGKNVERYGHLPAPSTNNIGEMTAVIEALKLFKDSPYHITIYTDSQYVTRGIKEWIHNWKKRGWKTSDKKDVKNKDLWIEFDALNSMMSVTYLWVKGHSGDELNDRADALANMGSDNL